VDPSRSVRSNRRRLGFAAAPGVSRQHHDRSTAVGLEDRARPPYTPPTSVGWAAHRHREGVGASTGRRDHQGAALARDACPLDDAARGRAPRTAGPSQAGRSRR
jgi:hypothetical protein